MEQLVKIDNASMSYHTLEGEVTAVKDMTFDIYKGEFLSIVGPSGCGKSTVLSLISGLIMPSSGSIRINGEPVTGPNGEVAYMLQRDHLFDWRNIEQNILLGLQVQKKCTPEARKNAMELLRKYGLKDFSRYYPRQLSGGMRQKVALIRTLAVNPEILLLDEPFSSLDYQTRLALSDEIGTIIRNEGKTAVLVTHDIAEAISMSDRVIVFSQRPSVVKMSIDIELDECHSPIKRRQMPKFQSYFDILWKELDVHVE